MPVLWSAERRATLRGTDLEFVVADDLEAMAEDFKIAWKVMMKLLRLFFFFHEEVKTLVCALATVTRL